MGVSTHINEGTRRSYTHNCRHLGNKGDIGGEGKGQRVVSSRPRIALRHNFFRAHSTILSKWSSFSRGIRHEFLGSLEAGSLGLDDGCSGSRQMTIGDIEGKSKVVTCLNSGKLAHVQDQHSSLIPDGCHVQAFPHKLNRHHACGQRGGSVQTRNTQPWSSRARTRATDHWDIKGQTDCDGVDGARFCRALAYVLQKHHWRNHL